MINTVLVLNQRGDPIFIRAFREGVSNTAADAYRTHYKSGKTHVPVVRLGKQVFCHKKVKALSLVATVDPAANVMLVFTFLQTIADTLEAFFETELTEALIEGNVVVIQELLDEMCDHGYPQTTDVATLRMFVHVKGQRRAIKKEDQKSISIQATGAVSHRAQGIRYAR
ncbi:clathrin adaptor, mu subunit [Kipferlia bialata]|uniref:Clathrin adaptor, mu subunit n=1 Tax=Kipferlia bialata TaxID=797122 RepID=A0A9K3GMB9_9EUKA|nr:clathrin adaptor, mu subunit [Kipferlia bialata]|eukprot:g11491.t1